MKYVWSSFVSLLVSLCLWFGALAPFDAFAQSPSPTQIKNLNISGQLNGNPLPTGPLVGTTDPQNLTNKTAPTQSQGDNSTKIANTSYVDTGLATKPSLLGGVIPIILGGTGAPTAAGARTALGAAASGANGDITSISGLTTALSVAQGGTGTTTSTGTGATVRSVSPLISGPTVSGGVTLNGSTSGTTILQPTATAGGTLTLPATTDTLMGVNTAASPTNKTFDTGSIGNVFKINGTQVSAVTGTGSAVLSESPKLSAATFTNDTNYFGGTTHGAPNSYYVNVSGTDGSGGSLVFLNNNSAGSQKTAAYINCGLLTATAGAEQGLCDFDVFDGANNKNRIISQYIIAGGTGATFGPKDDNFWDLGIAGYRWRNVYAVNLWGNGANATNTTRQALQVSSLANLPTSATQYFTVQQSSFENLTQLVFPVGGTVKNLYVKSVNNSPGGTASYAFTVRINTASSPITCTITGSSTSCNDTNHSATVSAGDVWTIQSVPTGTPTSLVASVGLEFIN